MNKKYIIAFLLTVVAAVSFLALHANRNDAESKQVRLKAFIKLTEVAQKVPISGLPQMAAAIKRYHKKFKAYPARLDELYPEFIPHRPFIDEINWYYEPREDNFFLSKTVKRGKRQLVASIDRNMKPRVGTGTTVAVAEKPKPEEETPVLALKPIETIQPIEPLPMEKPSPEALIRQPEIVSMVEGEIGHGLPTDISRKLLVWKDKNGVLGFGNVIYPDSRNMTIYKDGSWVNIKKPAPPARTQAKTEAAAPGKKRDYGNKMLVWKNADGTTGYGNVLYPRRKKVTIYQNEEWVSVEPAGSDKSQKAGAAPPVEKKKPDEVASNYSKKMYVWKDKKGNIGYGNVQYPSMDEIAYICVNGNWQKVVN